MSLQSWIKLILWIWVVLSMSQFHTGQFVRTIQVICNWYVMKNQWYFLFVVFANKILHGIELDLNQGDKIMNKIEMVGIFFWPSLKIKDILNYFIHLIYCYNNIVCTLPLYMNIHCQNFRKKRSIALEN